MCTMLWLLCITHVNIFVCTVRTLVLVVVVVVVVVIAGTTAATPSLPQLVYEQFVPLNCCIGVARIFSAGMYSILSVKS